MRKVFTYSRKKPYSSVKNSFNDENSLKNQGLDNKTKTRPSEVHKQLITSIISNSMDSSGDTPQTKRHKDIRSLLSRVDCKLKFLELNESADFHKFYRHKNIILSEIRGTDQNAKLADVLDLLKQSEVFSFETWFWQKNEYFINNNAIS
jgi:hypothetical protein